MRYESTKRRKIYKNFRTVHLRTVKYSLHQRGAVAATKPQSHTTSSDDEADGDDLDGEFTSKELRDHVGDFDSVPDDYMTMSRLENSIKNSKFNEVGAHATSFFKIPST